MFSENNLNQALACLGFLELDKENELIAENFHACNTKSDLKFCNRVLVHHELCHEDIRLIKSYYGNFPYTLWIPEEKSKLLSHIGLTKLTQFPMLALDKQSPALIDDHFKIIKLSDKSDILSDWGPVCAKGYNIEENEFRKLVNYFLSTPAFAKMNFYIGFIGNIPAATGMWIHRNSFADIHWICTLPEFRKRGLGLAITQKIVGDIQEKTNDAVLYSSSAGYPLYRNLGFVDVINVTVFDKFTP